MPPHTDNEKGYFEPIEIVAIHDRMLASAGLTWFDWEPMPRSWYDSNSYGAYREELVEAAKHDFSGREPFLLKDPRICRFVKVWLDVFDRINVNPVVIFQYRHPEEVARSLKARDGLPIAQGLLIWLRHIVDAEKATRAIERSFCNYTHLLGDWQAELAPVLETSRARLPKTSARAAALAGDFLDHSLRHQVKLRSVSDTELHVWLSNSLNALERLRVDPYDSEAMAELDTVRNQFDLASAAFSPAFQQLSLQSNHIVRAAARVAEAEAALAASQQSLGAATAAAEHLPAIMAELNDTRRILAATQKIADQVPGLEVELAGKRQALEAIQPALNRIPTLEVELGYTRHALKAVERRADRVPSLIADLDAARQVLERVQPIAERVERLDAELAEARESLIVSQLCASRVPDLEELRVAGLHEIAELQQQLGVATRKFNGTIKGRFRAFLRVLRGR